MAETTSVLVICVFHPSHPQEHPEEQMEKKISRSSENMRMHLLVIWCHLIISSDVNVNHKPQCPHLSFNDEASFLLAANMLVFVQRGLCNCWPAVSCGWCMRPPATAWISATCLQGFRLTAEDSMTSPTLCTALRSSRKSPKTRSAGCKSGKGRFLVHFWPPGAWWGSDSSSDVSSEESVQSQWCSQMKKRSWRSWGRWRPPWMASSKTVPGSCLTSQMMTKTLHILVCCSSSSSEKTGNQRRQLFFNLASRGRTWPTRTWNFSRPSRSRQW